MIKTLLVAGIAAFVGKKLYDKGTFDPYIAEARKQLKAAFPEAGETDAAPAIAPRSFKITPPAERSQTVMPTAG